LAINHTGGRRLPMAQVTWVLSDTKSQLKIDNRMWILGFYIPIQQFCELMILDHNYLPGFTTCYCWALVQFLYFILMDGLSSNYFRAFLVVLGCSLLPVLTLEASCAFIQLQLSISELGFNLFLLKF
jgi:hypothetical protein